MQVSPVHADRFATVSRTLAEKQYVYPGDTVNVPLVDAVPLRHVVYPPKVPFQGARR